LQCILEFLRVQLMPHDCSLLKPAAVGVRDGIYIQVVYMLATIMVIIRDEGFRMSQRLKGEFD